MNQLFDQVLSLFRSLFRAANFSCLSVILYFVCAFQNSSREKT